MQQKERTDERSSGYPQRAADRAEQGPPAATTSPRADDDEVVTGAGSLTEDQGCGYRPYSRNTDDPTVSTGAGLPSGRGFDGRARAWPKGTEDEDRGKT